MNCVVCLMPAYRLPRAVRRLMSLRGRTMSRS